MLYKRWTILNILRTFCQQMERIVEEFAEFDPTKHGLHDTFRLTDYANLKG